MSVKSDWETRVTNVRNTTSVDGVITQDQTQQRSFVAGNTKVSQSVPNYKKIIASGGNATSAFSGTKVIFDPGSGSAYFTHKYTPNPFLPEFFQTVHYEGSGDILFTNAPFPPSDPASLSESDAEIQARLQFLAKYRSKRTTFQSGTFFGELAETVRMLKSPAKALRESLPGYFQAVKKLTGHTRSRKSLNKAIRESYLEWQYGVKPLANDIDDAMRLLAARPDRYTEVISATASANVEASDSSCLTVTTPVDAQFVYKLTGQVIIRYKGSVSAGFESPPGFNEQFGFNVSNFLPTVWNLIPYSFLVDYFSNIGRVIDAASLGTVSLGWGCKTVRKTYTIILGAGKVRNVSSPPFFEVTSKGVNVSGFKSERKAVYRSRVDNVSAGISDVRFKVPGIDSPWKWLNIAALGSLRSLPFQRRQ
jgi:hypothetical protein